MLSGKDYNHHGFLNKPWLFSFNMAVVDALHNTEQIVAGGVVAPFCGLEYVRKYTGNRAEQSCFLNTG